MAKITKKDFETKLHRDNPSGNIQKGPYVEHILLKGELKASRMTLYYLNDKHIGTWQSGYGHKIK
jgi:hypothetical protein